MNSEKILQSEIAEKSLNAPRLIPHDIDVKIKNKTFYFLPELITVCVLVLENGFKVTGLNHSSVSPENFDRKIAEELAFQDARKKVWELEGYLLKQEIYLAKQEEGSSLKISRVGLRALIESNKGAGYTIAMSYLESILIDEAMILSRGSQKLTANLLGVSRSTIVDRIRKMKEKKRDE